ncbi:MAG: bifunctional metallophosphatase/5'-nucleotidase [candidate division KSB1 bacterium]|nr:bifunctional metallophosphatase/5'-nucleotidase [candidate division KSB1 bacterium]MDZ7365993.1 bifunctional metallophosphatase/5'-nucleotidase [candidate division KSB1 bacterium]MDZ7404110.1 bifunctional metallophosphatase/5'-nucleotidase [candidate division KSB1 bacterium]
MTRKSFLRPSVLSSVVSVFVLAFSPPAPHDTIVKITLLQINDVYEITPVSGGKEGGMARLATLRKQLAAQNPNTFMILAGDLFSPSALGTARVEGARLDGKQMVEVLNVTGLNYCTFGNHEFDLREQPFLQRLSESRFTWFSGNAFDRHKKPFPNVKENVIFTVTNASKQVARIGLIGVTMTKNKPDYVTYLDPLEAAKKQSQALRSQVDILIAVTHLPLEDDVKLAQTVPGIDLILGGHEHENVQVWRGANFTPIFKADANARSAYIHHLTYDVETRLLQIESKLQPITDKIPEDPETGQVVQRWVDLAFGAFRTMGFEPGQLVVNSPVTLDGRELTVRNYPGKLTDLIAEGFLNAAPGAELAICNGGSIRIDDELPPGTISEYDVIRILPFGGHVVSVEMRGRLLKQVLDQGRANKGTGGFLQTARVSWREEKGDWLINGKPLDQRRNYKAAISDFLLTGNEHGLGFLNRQNPDLKVVNDNVMEVRRALMAQLQKEFGQKK